MSELDMDHLRGWIGREDIVSDIVTPGLLDRFRATFDGHLFPMGQAAPLGLHWCLAPLAVPPGALGHDGHPARGGFLPPVPLTSRMWAGGQVRFHGLLRGGDTVTRRSRIADVARKDGRSGALVFVTVTHDILVGDTPVIEERQDIVYRNPTPQAATTLPTDPPPKGAFVADPVMMFRYSAMTFNGHRIHYDHPYVTGVEGYPGLVVHGPLQATLLMNAAARHCNTGAIQITYRGLSPLIAGQGALLRNADGTRVWLEKTDGITSMTADFAPL